MRIRLSLAAATAAILSASLVVRPAHADTSCPAPDDAPLVASVDTERRLDYLARAFDEEVHDTDAWSWTLGSAFIVAGGIQAGALPVYKNDRATSIDLTVGAVTFGIGAISLFLTPLQVTLPLKDSRGHWNDPDRCAVLARAERTLVAVAKEEGRETGWFPHVANIAVNTAATLILALGYGHGQQAAISAVIGVSVGEANVLTQPHHLQDVLVRYRSGSLDGPLPKSKVGLSLAPMANVQAATLSPIPVPQASGAGIALSF